MSMVDMAMRPRMPISSAARPISSGQGPPASRKQVVPQLIIEEYAVKPLQ